MSKRWVLKCKECRAECVYAEIPESGASHYFLQKKPDIPPAFMYSCSTCGHSDSYERRDLVYQDDAIATTRAKTKCSASEQAKAHGA